MLKKNNLIQTGKAGFLATTTMLMRSSLFLVVTQHVGHFRTTYLFHLQGSSTPRTTTNICCITMQKSGKQAGNTLCSTSI